MERRNWSWGHRRIGAHGHLFGLWLGRGAEVTTAHGLGPFAGPPRFLEPGQARLAILSLLEAAPRHGYEIMKEFALRSGGLYRASAGTVYPTLQLLEDEDLVVSKRKDGKKVYELTATGHDELTREAGEVKHIWRRAAQWEDWSKWMGPQSALFMTPIGALMKATFQAAARARDDPKRVERVREILERATAQLEHLAAGGPRAARKADDRG